MKPSRIISRYITKTGILALEVVCYGETSYSYQGKHGAGCGASLDDMVQTIRSVMRHHKGVQHASGFALHDPAGLALYKTSLLNLHKA